MGQRVGLQEETRHLCQESYRKLYTSEDSCVHVFSMHLHMMHYKMSMHVCNDIIPLTTNIYRRINVSLCMANASCHRKHTIN